MNKYNWATEDVYKSEKEWNDDFCEAFQMLDFSEFKGKLGEKQGFLACVNAQEKLSRKIEKLSIYAMMKHDENTKDTKGDEMLAKVMSLDAQISAELAFVMPELTSLDESVLNGYIEDKDLSEYDYFLKGVLKEKAHVLSENEERLLALGSEAMSSFREIFTKIDNADINFGAIKDGDVEIPLSHGIYGVVMHGEDRKLRKKAYNQYYGGYISLINTICATYYGSVKKDVFYAKAKKYASALEMALDGEDVDKTVYEKLIKNTNKALPLLHKYMSAKKKELKLKTMYMYDVYVPVVEGAELKLDYDEAYDLVVKGLAPLGKEYQELLIKAKNDRWIDVEEKDGKKSGAYSVAAYDTHPFVLLNYQKTTHDVFTIAHEMGHSLHSYFANKTQPHAKADYKIFVAEVASTVNEVLLIKHLIANEKDKKLKKFLLSYLLEMTRTTLFRQTQFAEFEEFSHKMVEMGEPLTKDDLCDKYLELNEKYYGRAVKSDDNIKYEWARIPHFYRAFYVYKYATGIISAFTIVDRILTEGKPAVDDYFKFLSSGGKDSPVELLKIAGVNLTDDKPFKSAFELFKQTLEEFIKL